MASSGVHTILARGLVWFATPHDDASLEFLAGDLDVPCLKVGQHQIFQQVVNLTFLGKRQGKTLCAEPDPDITVGQLPGEPGAVFHDVFEALPLAGVDAAIEEDFDHSLLITRELSHLKFARVPQVSDLKWWNSQAALDYNINGVPANFLVDPSGKIIAKNLRGEALQTKLSELFN